jgi:hypothetical protein
LNRYSCFYRLVRDFFFFKLVFPFKKINGVFDFKNRYTKILNIKENNISNIDIMFRRGDIRYFLLNPEKKEECKNLWKILMHTKRDDLSNVFSIICKTWLFHDITMFLFFMTYILNITSETATKEIIQYTDSDFLKMCPYDTKINILCKWFEKYIINVLEDF